MVHVTTPRPSIGSALGNALGSVGAQEFQRYRAQSALNDLRNKSKQPGQTPSDLLFNLIEASQFSPQIGRALGPLYQTLSQQMLNKPLSQMPGPGQVLPPQATAANTENVSPQQENATNLPFALPQPTVDPTQGALEETALGMGPIPKTYSPDEYRAVESQYRSANLDPTPAVEAMKRQDEVARQRINDLVSGAKTQADLAALRSQRQLEFRNTLREQLSGISEPDLAIAESISQRPEFKKIPNDKLRAEAVSKEYRLYENAKNSFNEIATRSNYDQKEYSRQIENLRSYAQRLIENGQYAEATKILAQNGWGATEIETILNPLNKEIIQRFSHLPELKPIDQEIRAFPDSPEFDKQFEKAREKRNKELEKYKEFLSKTIKPGAATKPGTSLLQLRDKFMQKGGTFQEFESLINHLKNSDEIELDQYQSQKELPLLAEHPSASMGLGEIIWRLNPLYIPRK